MDWFKENWKRDLDREAENQRRERQKLAKQKEEADRQAAIQAEARERQREKERLVEHGNRFQCHVCGKRSKGPHSYWHNFRSYDPDAADPDGEVRYDWDAPDDLKACSECGKYACEKHIYRGICKKCAKKR